MTDSELVEAVAARVMRWPVYRVSGHRPGTRPLPHAWSFRGAVMVYDGAGNRAWDPVNSADDVADVLEAMEMRGTPITLVGPRRSVCEAALAALDGEPQTGEGQ